jgi:hypothetical protein
MAHDPARQSCRPFTDSLGAVPILFWTHASSRMNKVFPEFPVAIEWGVRDEPENVEKRHALIYAACRESLMTN